MTSVHPVEVDVVLVRPELPANIGSAARALRNAGLSRLVLVEPGDWRTLECWRTAWGAQAILEEARIFDSLAAALAEASLVFALTGRQKGEASAPTDVRDAAAELAASGGRGCLVFGPEATGLTNEEIQLCGRRATIPSHPEQPSLNLSHAVMVAAYEVYRASRGGAPARPAVRSATHGETQSMLDLLRAGLLHIRALPDAPDEAHSDFVEWTGFLKRAALTPREVRLLEHAARKMARAQPGRRRGEPEPESS